jgi:hypothetical protein
MNRILFCSPVSLARTGSLHPHEVPASSPDHHIEIRRFNLFNMGPIVTKGLSPRVNTIRQRAPAAQKDGMQHHGFTLLEVTIGVVFGSMGVEILSGFSAESFTFGSAPEDSSCGKPVASDWLSDRATCISVRWRAER